MRTFGLVAALLASVMPIVAASAQTTPTAPSTRSAPVGYMLDAGDKMRITVYEEPDLTGTYEVADSGDISFPLIGNVKAAGASIVDLQNVIADKLSKGYVKQPKVSVELTSYRPFYILGEINKPGEYPYRVGIMVDQAVAAAGGYSYRANTKEVFLRHAGEDQGHKVKLNGPAVRVLPGDTIRVGERYF